MKLIPIERGGAVSAEVGRLPPEATAALQATGALYDAVGFAPPWICYVAIEDSIPVGTCGFKSPPHQDRVEIAYFTFPAFEGKGIATAMARKLLAVAKDAAPGIVVTAQTLPGRNASHRILEKHGFARVGLVEHPEDGTVLEWQK